MTMSPSIEKLFNKNRLDGSVFQLLLLMFYTPLGLVVMVIRLFISLQLILAVTVLPREATITRLILRCLCGVLGLLVRQENLHRNPLYEDDDGDEVIEGADATSSSSSPETSGDDEIQGGQEAKEGCTAKRKKRRLVVLSNHITPFDHFALSTVMPCIKVSCNGEGIPWPLSYLLGNQVMYLQQPPWSPSPQHQPANTAAANTILPPPSPPRRDDIFLTKLRNVINLGGRRTLPTSTTTNTSSISGAGYSSNTSAGTSVATGTVTSSNNQIKRAGGGRDGLPLLLFPEDGTTNGTVGLMQYRPWCGSVCGPRPSVVTLKVRRVPSLPLAPSVLRASFAQDLLALLFCPLTVYTVRYLGRVARLPEESDTNFCKRVQTVTADTLGLQSTSYDVLEKVEYNKRCLAAQQQSNHGWSSDMTRPRGGMLGGGVSSPLPTSELHTLARQVHEVLPHLPLTAILSDIARTGNVDITITNFLEGAVPDYIAPSSSGLDSATSFGGGPHHSSSPQFAFTNPFSSASTSSGLVEGSVSSAATSVASALSNTASSQLINLNTKAESFPRCATDRMLSFHERKTILLQNALRKYVEKFGLHAENDPYMTQACS